VIAQAFRCPVVSHYSAWEALHLAQSCPDRPEVFHVNAERAIVRVVGEDGRAAAPGERGRVLVTDLANHVMPFIQYDLGDVAVAGKPCPCGRGLPTLAEIEGRVGEVIETPAGRRIAPGALERLLTFRCGIGPYVWEYQAVQTAPDRVVLRVVPTARLTDAVTRRLAGELGAFLGPEMRVAVEPVDRIPPEPSGKRLVIRPLGAAP
jgi:phenylacetate-CoA ligase